MVEHINVQDGGFAIEIATNASGYGYFNPYEIEINNGTFETSAENGGAIRLAIYDGKFYMLGDVLLNDYVGEIYEIPKSTISHSSCTMKKVVVENKRVISVSGKIKNFNVLATLGNSENNNTQSIIKTDNKTNIKLETQKDVIPDNTIMDITEITSGETFNTIKDTLEKIKNFKAFDITLKSNNTNIQPNGNVKISIPIPEDFDTSKLVVYRFEEDGSNIEYQVAVANGYATFETDHFSTYVLGEQEKVSSETQDKNVIETTTENNTTKLPQTGEETNAFARWLTIVIPIMAFWLGSMLLIDYEKKKMTKE